MMMKNPKKKKNINLLMFVSLLIATSLWLYVMIKEDPKDKQTYNGISVQVKNIETLKNRDMVLLNEDDDYAVSVRVEGLKSELLHFDASNIVAFVDLSGYGEGEMKVPVEVRLKNNNQNIKIYDVQPKELKYTFEKIITQEKFINVKTEGELLNGNLLGEVSTDVDVIKITGPRSQVNRVVEAVAVADVTGRKEKTNLTLPIILLDSEKKVVTEVAFEPKVVNVSVTVLKKKTVPIELVLFNNLPEGMVKSSIELNPSTVEIMGTEPGLNITKLTTVPKDINDFIVQSSQFVDLSLPDNLQLVNPQMKIEAKVVIMSDRDRILEVPSSRIQFKNLASGYGAYVSNPIVIRVERTDRVSLDEEAFRDAVIVADLSGLSEGTHQVALTIENWQGAPITIMPEKTLVEIIKQEVNTGE